MRNLTVLLVVGALSAFGLAACGDDDDDGTTASSTATTDTTATGGGGGGGANTVQIAADPSQFAFDTTSLTGTEGTNTFEFTNPSGTPHDFCVESGDEDYGCTDQISGGDSDTLEVDLEADEDYTFYCSVDGHRAAGMEGELTVE